MPTLRELQTAFGRALTDPRAVDVTAFVMADGIPAARRIQVYRNNLLANLGGALEAIYPVVRRLSGDEFFRQVSRAYVRAVPSRCGDLHAYGEGFPEWLARLPELAALGYLGDVARLEWAYHQVFHAKDAPPLDLASLADVPADRRQRLHLALHPATALLQSPYPVLRIWQVNQEDWSGEQTVSLDEGGDDILVRRQGGDVEFMRLGPAEHGLLAALSRGGSLEQAVIAALRHDGEFDVGACLIKHVQLGTFVEQDGHHNLTGDNHGNHDC